MKSVLLTGSGGFLGSYVGAECLARGWRVHALMRAPFPDVGGFASVTTSATETADFDSLLANAEIECCFHFAGASNVGASIADPFTDFSNSLPGVAKLLDAVRKRDPACHVILASSAAVYGNPQELPISEDLQCSPISPYGVHKLLVEQMAMHYCRLYGLRVTAMRIFSAYGEGLRKQLLWDAACKVAKANSSGADEVSFFGTGKETRDFIHGRDVARAAVKIAETIGDGFTPVNIASGHETQVAEVVSAIRDVIAPGLGINFTGSVREGDPQRWRADVSKLRTLRGVPSRISAGDIATYAGWAVEELAKT